MHAHMYSGLAPCNGLGIVLARSMPKPFKQKAPYLIASCSCKSVYLEVMLVLNWTNSNSSITDCEYFVLEVFRVGKFHFFLITVVDNPCHNAFVWTNEYFISVARINNVNYLIMKIMVCTYVHTSK